MKALLNAIIRILFGRSIPKFSDNMLRKAIVEREAREK